MRSLVLLLGFLATYASAFCLTRIGLQGPRGFNGTRGPEGPAGPPVGQGAVLNITGLTTGTLVVGENKQLQVSAKGNLVTTGSVTTSVGITLPTTGGTATSLNYYEEWRLLGFIFTTGAGYSKNINTTVTIVRVGKMVTMRIATGKVTGNGGTSATFVSTTAIPSRFCPPDTDTVLDLIAVDNGSNGGVGGIAINQPSTGFITVGSTQNINNFGSTSGLIYGWGPIQVTWSILS